MNACVLASQSTKMAAFLWTAEKTNVLIDLYEKILSVQHYFNGIIAAITHKVEIFLATTIFTRTKCCMQHCCNVVHAKITCNMLHVTCCMVYGGLKGRVT